MRLIDADVIEKFLDDFADDCGNHQKAVLREVKYALGKMPTVDAEPVKHGRWIDPATEDCYRCSVCEEYTQMEIPRLLYHYCPNCGAKMDGGDL